MMHCPICKAPSVSEFRPFCSRGCRDKDLLQWFGEGYRIAGRSIVPDGVDSADDRD